jgi:hypothetical protein
MRFNSTFKRLTNNDIKNLFEKLKSVYDNFIKSGYEKK